MWYIIAVFAFGSLMGGIAFYFIGRRKGFEKGHWIGQKHALEGVLPQDLIREIIGNDERVSFPTYSGSGKLLIKCPHPGHFRLGLSTTHRLPVYAEVYFETDKLTGGRKK